MIESGDKQLEGLEEAEDAKVLGRDTPSKGSFISTHGVVPPRTPGAVEWTASPPLARILAFGRHVHAAALAKYEETYPRVLDTLGRILRLCGLTIMIIFVGGAAFRIVRIDGTQWAISILVALPCWLWAIVIRCLPDKYFAVVFDALVKFLTVVLRPIFKGLRVVFHPVAQLFRGMGRVTKRVFKKKGSQEEEEEERPRDAESAAGQPAMAANVPEVKVN